MRNRWTVFGSIMDSLWIRDSSRSTISLFYLPWIDVERYDIKIAAIRYPKRGIYINAYDVFSTFNNHESILRKTYDHTSFILRSIRSSCDPKEALFVLDKITHTRTQARPQYMLISFLFIIVYLIDMRYNL